MVEDRPIDLDIVPNNGFIVRNIYNSLDPYMRLMLVHPDTKHYRKPYALDEPLRSLSVAEVIRSSTSLYPQGTLVRTSLPIQQYSKLSAQDIAARSSAASSATLKTMPSTSHDTSRLAHWLGPLGMPGLTAYSSIFEIGKPQSGETIFVSSAMGAVGQMVGQICKIYGLRVIGSAGSTEKCELLERELNFDATFNYKQEATKTALQRLAPDGIDIYYDNVGGKTLEVAIACMKTQGRIVICGMISQYNSTSSHETGEGDYGVKHLFQFVSKGLTMKGFQVGMTDFGPKYEGDFEKTVQLCIEQGAIKPVMSGIVGIENGAKAFVDMLQGRSLGKAVLRFQRSEEAMREDVGSDAIYQRIQ